MATTIMPRATAVWLIENTSLTFTQIADFCGLHILEIEAIADTDDSIQMEGLDPIASGQLSLAEIKKCEIDSSLRLQAQDAVTVESVLGKKSKKYTPIVKRKDRPDGIAWLIKYCPALTETQICRLVGTTKGTIDSIKSKKHWNIQNIRPKHPVQIGLCSSEDLEKELMVAEAIEDSKKHN